MPIRLPTPGDESLPVVVSDLLASPMHESVLMKNETLKPAQLDKVNGGILTNPDDGGIAGPVGSPFHLPNVDVKSLFRGIVDRLGPATML